MPPDETIRAALVQAADRLAMVSDTPRLDAELLMAHALGVSRSDLLLHQLDSAVPEAFAALIELRLTHAPVAYLTGTRSFWTIELSVGPGVLVPRPDSETLIEAAVAHFGATPGPARVLDLGTGPGTLLLAALAEWPGATGLGIDQSPDAIDYARANADRLGMGSRAAVRQGDWTTGIDGRFDLILCNPPYIGTDERLPEEVRRHEPELALFAGLDGLDAYRRILPDLPRLLAPGGLAAIEIGATQAQAVMALAAPLGLKATLRHDLANRPRAVLLG